MILASSIPQSAYAPQQATVNRLALFPTSAWMGPGTMNRALEGGGGYDWLPWSDMAKQKVEKAAHLAVELGFTEVVIDFEVQGPRMPGYFNDPAAALLGLQICALTAGWVRKAEPKLLQGYYGICPAQAAAHMNENTPVEQIDAYDALGELEARTMRPDFVVVDCYYGGAGWYGELTRRVERADRFFPQCPRRILISPSDYTPGKTRPDGTNEYVGKKLLRTQVRLARPLGRAVELWTDSQPPGPGLPPAMPWAAQAFDDVADLARS